MKSPTFLSAAWVSLAMGPQQLKLISVRQTKKKIIIEQVLTINYPTPIIVDGRVKRFDVLNACLKAYVSQYHLKGLPVIISFPVSLVRMEKIWVARSLSLEAIERLISRRIEEDLQQPQAELAFDFGESKVQGTKMEISFVAARKDYIVDITDCIISAGLRLKVIDIDVQCLNRLLPVEEIVTACVHISEGEITFLLTNAGEIIFYKQWHHALLSLPIEEQLYQQKTLCCEALKIPIIKKWFIFCDKNDEDRFKDLLTEEELIFLKLPHLFTISPKVDKDFFAAHTAKFAFACGALKRVLPIW